MLTEHQIWRWCHDHTSSPPYFSWLTINLHPKNDNSLLLNTLTSAGADPGFFLGGGALVSCSTSTPINHMVFFYRIPVVLENRRSSRGGGGVHPLHPPPRSAPVSSSQYIYRLRDFWGKCLLFSPWIHHGKRWTHCFIGFLCCFPTQGAVGDSVALIGNQPFGHTPVRSIKIV